MAIAWRVQARMAKPLIGATFALPDRTDLTPRLIGGAALFGTGWGIAGLCPGPGFAALAIEPAKAAAFVAAMRGGMLIVRFFEPQRQSVGGADEPMDEPTLLARSHPSPHGGRP